jgi:hypothetical protein
LAAALAAPRTGNSLRGEHGLLEVLRQLQGFEIPASAWERHILAHRVAAYNGAALVLSSRRVRMDAPARA